MTVQIYVSSINQSFRSTWSHNFTSQSCRNDSNGATTIIQSYLRKLKPTTMTVMKPEQAKSIPLKVVGYSVKFSLASQQNKESPNDDACIQSTNTRRRYQRRGSKVPSMIMAGIIPRPQSRQIDDIDLLEIQKRILADKEFLLSLQLADAREASRTKCMKRRASLELVSKSPIPSRRGSAVISSKA
jgi:hypothetical protein